MWKLDRGSSLIVKKDVPSLDVTVFRFDRSGCCGSESSQLGLLSLGPSGRPAEFLLLLCSSSPTVQTECVWKCWRGGGMKGATKAIDHVQYDI